MTSTTRTRSTAALMRRSSPANNGNKKDEKRVAPLTEDQLAERLRVRSGVLADFDLMVVFNPASNTKWEIINRSELEYDPPGVTATVRVTHTTRKQLMPFRFRGSSKDEFRYFFSRIEAG